MAVLGHHTVALNRENLMTCNIDVIKLFFENNILIRFSFEDEIIVPAGRFISAPAFSDLFCLNNHHSGPPKQPPGHWFPTITVKIPAKSLYLAWFVIFKIFSFN